MEDHGTVFATRAKLVRERVEAMKAIWTETKPEYHGEFVNFGPMMAWPKPVQKPHPPVIVGGAFPHGARRAVRYGEGWIPLAGRPGQYGDVFETVPKFRAMLQEAGRDPATCPVSIFRGGGGRRHVEALSRSGYCAGDVGSAGGEGGCGAADSGSLGGADPSDGIEDYKCRAALRHPP